MASFPLWKSPFLCLRCDVDFQTEPTDIYKSLLCTAVFDLPVSMWVVLIKLYWDLLLGFWLAFLVPGLVVLRNPQIPQMLPLPRCWVTGRLCPWKTCSWIANSLLQGEFGERLQHMASFLLSGEVFLETQRLKSLCKKTKAPPSPLCCSVFTCSHQQVRMPSCPRGPWGNWQSVGFSKSSSMSPDQSSSLMSLWIIWLSALLCPSLIKRRERLLRLSPTSRLMGK